jgi:hypothetical protein
VSTPLDDVAAWIPALTPTGLLGLVFLLVITGKLVPPKLVPRDEYERVKAERDQMTQLAMTTLAQNQKLLAASLRTADVLESFPIQERKGEG